MPGAIATGLLKFRKMSVTVGIPNTHQ